MRRGHRTVGSGHLLFVAVVKVREIEILVPRPDFHLGERITQVGIAKLVQADRTRVVGIDGDERQAIVLVIIDNPLQPLFVVLRGRAMIAGEDNHENSGFLEIFERVFLSVHTGQLEVGRAGAERKCGGRLGLGGREA